MLETHLLKQQHHQLRQELSNALYENDAAKRVIARLVKERDLARENLAAVSAAAVPAANATVPDGTMEVDQQEPTVPELKGVTPELAEIMDQKSVEYVLSLSFLSFFKVSYSLSHFSLPFFSRTCTLKIQIILTV
jgi:hypothetical protein